jgi:hypothetical protein
MSTYVADAVGISNWRVTDVVETSSSWRVVGTSSNWRATVAMEVVDAAPVTSAFASSGMSPI